MSSICIIRSYEAERSFFLIQNCHISDPLIHNSYRLWISFREISDPNRRHLKAVNVWGRFSCGIKRVSSALLDENFTRRLLDEQLIVGCIFLDFTRT